MELPPAGFVFSSGAGGWATFLQLNADGTFSGQYFDQDIGDTGPGYPNGVGRQSIFSGRFELVEQVSPLEYRLKRVELDVEGAIGDEFIENDTLLNTTEPYGIDGDQDFVLYLPGFPVAELSEDVFSWCSGLDGETTTSQWILYNRVEEQAFCSASEIFSTLQAEVALSAANPVADAELVLFSAPGPDWLNWDDGVWKFMQCVSGEWDGHLWTVDMAGAVKRDETRIENFVPNCQEFFELASEGPGD